LQNRELQIMKQLKHTNVVELKNCFYSKGEKVCSATRTPFSINRISPDRSSKEDVDTHRSSHSHKLHLSIL